MWNNCEDCEESLKFLWNICEESLKKVWRKYEDFISWGGYNCENSYLFIKQSSWFYVPTFKFLKRAGLFKIEKLFEILKSQTVLENSDLGLKLWRKCEIIVKNLWNNCEDFSK